MLSALIYPVSGIMKLWHIILHQWLNLPDSRAWLFSIFGLIFTVRLIILPFFWKQMTNARVSYNLRPKIAALREEYAYTTDPAKAQEHARRRQKLYKEHNYSTAAGCVPALIQLPIFIGLYQVMLRMARPQDGIGSHKHHPIGLLTSHDVSSFLSVRVHGVPIPAYVSMSPQQFALLHTTHEQVYHFILPLVLCASLFTGINMVSSTIRMYITVDFNSNTAVRLQRTLLPFMAFGALFPTLYGLNGPFPAAIVLYWFGNNLWTLAQTNIIMLILHYRYPLSDEFREHRLKGKQERRDRIKLKRQRRWGLRYRRLLSLVTWGSPKTRIRSQIADITARAEEYDRRVAETKQKRKSAARALREARKQQKAAQEKDKASRQQAERRSSEDPAPSSTEQVDEQQNEQHRDIRVESPDGRHRRPQPGGRHRKQ